MEEYKIKIGSQIKEAKGLEDAGEYLVKLARLGFINISMENMGKKK